MSYLTDFREKIAANDYPGFLKLWEEYCYSDEPDGEELQQILLDTKKSDLVRPFGQHVNRALSLARAIKDPAMQHEVLKLIFDIQTLNSEDLAEMAFLYLKEKHGNEPLFEKKIHLIGLRNKQNFQGALSHFDLLSHIAKGKFVYHTAGWGTGEILDLSLIREELTLEFENVIGQKHLSFANAMRTLIPIADDHFLAKRFGNPDLLEKEAREHPIEALHLLLHDLGPKNATEIKEELCDLVIPSQEWSKWWQNAKTKLKKDTLIHCPKDTQEPFVLLKKEILHEESLVKALEAKPEINELIHLVYSHLRDFPETLKNKDLQASLQSKFTEILSSQTLSIAQKLQIYFLLDDLSLETDYEKNIQEILQTSPDVVSLLQDLDVLSYKKRALTIIRKIRKDWQEIFFSLFFSMTQNFLRDYLLSELLTIEPKEALKKKLEEILLHPLSYPQVFVWYFQKLLDPQTSLPFSDPKGLSRFLEGFFILLDYLENKPECREITKKMAQLLTANRYKVIRQIIQNASIAEVREFILLSTKCRLLSQHDIKIIHSLAEVVFPALADSSEGKLLPFEEEKAWVLQESYEQMRQKLEHISTKEMFLNAKEIEEARSHGDLKENAEYKAALEKRARIQSEIKTLSDALQKASILTKNDVVTDKVGIGTIVSCQNSKGAFVTFTLLGSWEASPEKNILSSQSKLAKRMIDKKIGDSFDFQEEKFTIRAIESFFDKKAL